MSPTPQRALRLPAALVVFCFLFGDPARVMAADDPMEIALNLAGLLRSARTVIADNQALINEPSTGDKGFTGQVVVEKEPGRIRLTMLDGEEIEIFDLWSSTVK